MHLYTEGLPLILLAAGCLCAMPAPAQDFHFDGSISRQVLENYLARSISYTELLHDDLGRPRNDRGVDPRDSIRLILECRAKLLGRALMLWGHESNLTGFLQRAKPYADLLHQADPDIILQAAAFEIVTRDVNTIPIPAAVFTAYGQPIETRNFRYEDMLYADGRQVNHWGNGASVPDMSRLETRLWFYFLARSYIDVGIEAIHFGQVGLMDWNDPGHAGWRDMLDHVRAYAHQHARRHFLLCDAHTPTGGYVEDGKLLFDFHSFPLRIAEVAGQPHLGILKVGYADSIFKRSKGGITPSGWACVHLPYLVEFDNFGSRNPGQPSQAPFIWGWDEITWFALLPETDRNAWLRYAWQWLKDTDPDGHLEMPGSRVLRPGSPDGPRWYWANVRSDACPNGFNTEATIKALWGTDAGHALAAGSYVPFSGEKTVWHDGFDRYDYVMDEVTQTITPFRRDNDEGFGVKAPQPGQRRCIVVVPRQVAPGQPWSWQGCYWDHEPQTEVELLRRGFHIVFISPEPDRQWDAWYTYLTVQHGLSKQPAFIGMSKGGVNEYDWATANPDKVSCIYADNPAIRPEAFAKLGELAKNDVPLLNICGSLDFLLSLHTLAIEESYHRLGGRITVMIKEGAAHHPHSLRNPKPIADWIVEHTQPTQIKRPDFADDTFRKSYYYSLENSYNYLKEEDTYFTGRGPGFAECYERYDVKTPSQWGIQGMAVIVTKTIAAGQPWVFRADPIERDALVDQALLAKGFHIVIAPLTEQAGPVQEQWDATYRFLTGHGFSRQPVLEGTGTAAGEAYAWAIANPDKVACIYAENPALRSLMTKAPLLDNLAPLARAGVPILHDCGSLDPWFKTQTLAVEERYKALGGHITVIVKPGMGHYPARPLDPRPIVDFILSHPANPGSMVTEHP